MGDDRRSSRRKGSGHAREVEVEWKVGARVDALWESENMFYPATVTGKGKDGVLKVKFDDQPNKTYEVDPLHVRLPSIEIETETRKVKVPVSREVANAAPKNTGAVKLGDAVLGNWKGEGQLYNAYVVKVHANGSANLQYEDGDEEWQVDINSLKLDKSRDSLVIAELCSGNFILLSKKEAPPLKMIIIYIDADAAVPSSKKPEPTCAISDSAFQRFGKH
jgi:hypothetical protein